MSLTAITAGHARYIEAFRGIEAVDAADAALPAPGLALDFGDSFFKALGRDITGGRHTQHVTSL